MADVGDFQYVDFATRGLGRFRNHVMHVQDLPRLIERYGHTDCYSTYFLFDKGLEDHVRDNRDSVSGYQGRCHANYLPFDINNPDLGLALETAREIGRCFEAVGGLVYIFQI